MLTWITFNRSIESNHNRQNMRNEITYPFPNFNGAAVDVWGWTSNFVPHFVNVGIKVIPVCKMGSGTCPIRVVTPKLLSLCDGSIRDGFGSRLCLLPHAKCIIRDRKTFTKP